MFVEMYVGFDIKPKKNEKICYSIIGNTELDYGTKLCCTIRKIAQDITLQNSVEEKILLKNLT